MIEPIFSINFQNLRVSLVHRCLGHTYPCERLRRFENLFLFLFWIHNLIHAFVEAIVTWNLQYSVLCLRILVDFGLEISYQCEQDPPDFDEVEKVALNRVLALGNQSRHLLRRSYLEKVAWGSGTKLSLQDLLLVRWISKLLVIFLSESVLRNFVKGFIPSTFFFLGSHQYLTPIRQALVATHVTRILVLLFDFNSFLAFLIRRGVGRRVLVFSDWFVVLNVRKWSHWRKIC